jgi:hypothetical protein
MSARFVQYGACIAAEQCSVAVGVVDVSEAGGRSLNRSGAFSLAPRGNFGAFTPSFAQSALYNNRI